ncbi:MAG: type 4a pilus biogenesis protein PilO [Bacteriovoracaceae bacterium]
MKELVNKIIVNVHWLILAWGLYGLYEHFTQHSNQVSSVETQMASLDNEIQLTQRKLQEIQEFVKRADEYKLRVEEVAKNIESIQKQLPSEINDTQIMTYLNHEMNVLNIKDPSLIPQKEITSSYYISKDYNLTAKGTFLQFMVFFERIGNATRIYNIKNLKLVLASANQKGRFQMINGEAVIQAFRYNPDFKVDRGFEKANP